MSSPVKSPSYRSKSSPSTSQRTPILSRSRRMPDTERLLNKEVEERKALEIQLNTCFDELKTLKANSNYQEMSIDQLKMQNSSAKRQYEVQIEILQTATSEKEEIIAELENENEQSFEQLQNLVKMQEISAKKLGEIEGKKQQLDQQLSHLEEKIADAVNQEEVNLRSLERVSKHVEAAGGEKQAISTQLEELKSYHFEVENGLITAIERVLRRRKLAKLVEFAVVLFVSFSFGLQVLVMVK